MSEVGWWSSTCSPELDKARMAMWRKFKESGLENYWFYEHSWAYESAARAAIRVEDWGMGSDG